MDDAKNVDKEFEKARAMRDLQCAWANFAPVDDSCQDYEDFMIDYCLNRGGTWDEYMWECMKPEDMDKMEAKTLIEKRAYALTKAMKLN